MRRPLVIAATTVALLAGSLAIVPAAHATNPVPPVQFGMHVPAISQGEDPGVSYGTVRLWDSGVAWGQVEQKKGKYWWNGLDASVANANQQNARILYVLGSSPQWAAINPKQGKYPNRGAASTPKMSDWKNWVTAVVQRHGDSIESYQIWNEANLQDFYQGTPKEMAKLTREAYKIIKRLDPGAKVVSASSTVRLESAYQRFFPAYMRELKKMGWPIDVVSVHTYPEGTGTPKTRADYLAQVDRDMRRAGVPANKELWDTEINYGIRGPGGIPGRQITGANAAAWVATTYLDNLLYGVDRGYWYYWYQPDGRLGIILQNGQPGAVAYQVVYNWLVDSFYTCTPGAVNVCQFGDNLAPNVVAWSASGGTYTVPANATVQCDALNQCSAVVPGSQVQIGSMPLWFGSDALNAQKQSSLQRLQAAQR
jgi:hypothetical protein